MTLALVLAAAVVVSFAGTAFARRYALTRQLIDNPNQRSSHAMPTPRGGGLAIVFSFVGGTAALWALGVLDEPAMPIFLISALSVAAIGFWDDHGHISARWRLLVHFIAAGALVAVVGQAPSITIASLTFNVGIPGIGYCGDFGCMDFESVQLHGWNRRHSCGRGHYRSWGCGGDFVDRWP